VHNAPAELEQRFPRVAIPLVLLDGVLNRLLGQAILQLKGHHGQTVDKCAQVQSPPGFIAAVVKLAGDAEAVGRVTGHGLQVFRRWRAIEQVETERAVLDAIPKDVDGPAPRDLALQAREKFLAGDVLLVLVIGDAELGRLFRLGGVRKAKSCSTSTENSRSYDAA
jgi:hypothetical protein